jgi:hypothetical protein
MTRALDPHRHTQYESNRILNQDGPLAAVIYFVSQVEEGNRVIGYQKTARPSDLSVRAHWQCGHIHSKWNEAVECPTTIMTGGEAVLPESS